MIGILDYGVGNVGAFLRIFHSHNVDATPIQSNSDFNRIDKIILPGVGSFDSAMGRLNKSGLRENLDEFVQNRNYPLLAVCIGMHMLGSSSDEGSSEGLGYINGKTKKIIASNENDKILIPHMGWNSIIKSIDDPVWSDIEKDEGFYFLHSYYFEPECKKTIIGTSDYHGNFACAVKSKKVYGFQFHPEKSLSNGIQLLLNFAEIS